MGTLVNTINSYTKLMHFDIYSVAYMILQSTNQAENALPHLLNFCILPSNLNFCFKPLNELNPTSQKILHKGNCKLVTVIFCLFFWSQSTELIKD